MDWKNALNSPSATICVCMCVWSVDCYEQETPLPVNQSWSTQATSDRVERLADIDMCVERRRRSVYSPLTPAAVCVDGLNFSDEIRGFASLRTCFPTSIRYLHVILDVYVIERWRGGGERNRKRNGWQEKGQSHIKSLQSLRLLYQSWFNDSAACYQPSLTSCYYYFWRL